jgi:hypothetical protein
VCCLHAAPACHNALGNLCADKPMHCIAICRVHCLGPSLPISCRVGPLHRCHLARSLRRMAAAAGYCCHVARTTTRRHGPCPSCPIRVHLTLSFAVAAPASAVARTCTRHDCLTVATLRVDTPTITPRFQEQNRNLHTCAQDVQITRTTNNTVNRYNISINYRVKSFKMTCGSKRKITCSAEF